MVARRFGMSAFGGKADISLTLPKTGEKLSRPAGNVTGLSMMTSDLNSKRLQLLRDVVPGLTRVAVLWNPDHPFHHQVIKELKGIAPSLSIALTLESVQAADDLDQTFADSGLICGRRSVLLQFEGSTFKISI